jgi:hypothetical protein
MRVYRILEKLQKKWADNKWESFQYIEKKRK